MNLVRAMRQWLHHTEFRIGDPPCPSEVSDKLQQLVAFLQEQAKTPPPDPNKTSNDKAQQRMLADVCTGLWRLRQKMLQPGSDRPQDSMRKPYRHFEAVWDTLKQAGIEVRDHLGELYNDGSGLEVAAFEPRPGISRDTIVDTVKPTICLKGKLLQVGQVIVGTPEKQA
jgi:hypothetical protein